MEICKAKQAIRKDMALRKKAYTKTQLQIWSEEIGRRLEETALFQAAHCIALYHALPDEVQTAAWIERWSHTKQIALPVVTGNDLLLLPYQGKESVRIGAFGIWEPIIYPDSKTIEQEVDLILVPGVAFDHDRNRLGRGKGFYDRLLTSLQVPKIGVCFDFQLIRKVPTETFDQAMDGVMTETVFLDSAQI